MSDILVAVIIDVVALAIIIGGILAGKRDGVRVIAVKTLLTFGGCVGIYFLTPTIIGGLNTINGFEEFVNRTFGFTVINALILAFGTLISLGFASIVGSIVKHSIIKNLKKSKANKIKIRLAKAINKKAEKDAEKKEKKRLKAEFKASKHWYTKLVSEFIALVLSLVVAFAITLPFKFIAQVIVNNNAEEQYLLEGYKYTLNGLVDELDLGITEFVVREEVADEEPESEPEAEVTEDTGAVEGDLAEEIPSEIIREDVVADDTAAEEIVKENVGANDGEQVGETDSENTEVNDEAIDAE